MKEYFEKPLQKHLALKEITALMGYSALTGDRRAFCKSAFSAEILASNLPRQDPLRLDINYVVTQFRVSFDEALERAASERALNEGLRAMQRCLSREY
jgi:hypothetical protein